MLSSGRRLLALFDDQTVVASAAIEALPEQQAALNSLTIHLRKVEPILNIRFAPDCGNIARCNSV